MRVEVRCSPTHSYEITISSSVTEELRHFLHTTEYSNIFLVSEQQILERWSAVLPEQVRCAPTVLLPPGEISKSLSSAEKLWQFFLEHRGDRSSLVIHLGGGMITDLGGFAASTYMRGMRFLNIPTTLLAQVDASVGGKTGINLGGTKNIVGTFCQPEAVLIGTEFLESLPERELRSGYAEVLKHGAIRDRSYFNEVVSSVKKDGIRCISEELIHRSCVLKRDIVVADEKERGMRKLLNFGHTFGHAFESFSHRHPEGADEFPLLHGEAVGLGMVAEGLLSRELGMFAPDEFQLLFSGIQELGLLPIFPKKVAFDELLPFLERDKKNSGGVISWTLLGGMGRGDVDQRVPLETVRAVFEQFLSCLDGDERKHG
ncbi:3-dehydroquinate synthase [bacterium]|nr:3-dehydroquinate synthase [bacterium]